jgi:CheY-like chemotaxis protein
MYVHPARPAEASFSSTSVRAGRKRNVSQAPVVVLVVDDEYLVRSMTAEVLRDQGFTVHEAQSGEVALALLRGGLQINALVTDVRMPEMSGLELAKHVLARQPRTKILYVSGFVPASLALKSGALLGELLPKPFSYDELAAAMKRLFRPS